MCLFPAPQMSELDLNGQQRHLEQLATQSKHLLEAAQALPGFNSEPLRGDTQTLQEQWLTSKQVWLLSWSPSVFQCSLVQNDYSR